MWIPVHRDNFGNKLADNLVRLGSGQNISKAIIVAFPPGVIKDSIVKHFSQNLILGRVRNVGHGFLII